MNGIQEVSGSIPLISTIKAALSILLYSSETSKINGLRVFFVPICNLRRKIKKQRETEKNSAITTPVTTAITTQYKTKEPPKRLFFIA